MHATSLLWSTDMKNAVRQKVINLVKNGTTITIVSHSYLNNYK
ncbi:MAG: hypothetical protein O4965_26670 [Trichodesmium sp. St19_bin1]|nr:hypothetical protein [Trichodesmium sp. St19_bin1]